MPFLDISSQHLPFRRPQSRKFATLHCTHVSSCRHCFFYLQPTLYSLPFSARTPTSNPLTLHCAARDCSLSTSPFSSAVCSNCSHQYRKFGFLFSLIHNHRPPKSALALCHIISVSPFHVQLRPQLDDLLSTRPFMGLHFCLRLLPSVLPLRIHLVNDPPLVSAPWILVRALLGGTCRALFRRSVVFLSLRNHFVEHFTLGTRVDGC